MRGPYDTCYLHIKHQAKNTIPHYKGFYFNYLLTHSCLVPSMMTSSDGNISRVTGPLWEESTDHRWIPHGKASNAELWCLFLDVRLKKRLSLQSRCWWFETPWRSLWHHCNEEGFYHWLWLIISEASSYLNHVMSICNWKELMNNIQGDCMQNSYFFTLEKMGGGGSV